MLRLAGELVPGNEEDEEIRRRRVKVDVENFDVTKQRSVPKSLQQVSESDWPYSRRLLLIRYKK